MTTTRDHMLIRGASIRLAQILAENGNASFAFRSVLMHESADEIFAYANDFDPDSPPLTMEIIHEMIDLFSILENDEYSRQEITMLYLDDSLCPMHHCDYAICFDDDDEECALIREYFPDHDT